MLLPIAKAQAYAIEAYGDAPEGTWARERGWSVGFGAVLVDAGITDDPSYAVMGERILQAVASERL
jgi:hypothetical protein